MSKLDEQLSSLQDVLLADLLKRLEDGTASATDRNTARQLLKDNGITSEPQAGSPMESLNEHIEDEDLQFLDNRKVG